MDTELIDPLPDVHMASLEVDGDVTTIRCETCGLYRIIDGSGMRTINQGDFFARHYGTVGPGPVPDVTLTTG